MKLRLFTASSATLLLLATITTANAGSGRFTSAAPTADSASQAQARPEVKIPSSAVVDEVVWVVGDEPILKSDVEVMRLQMETQGVHMSGDPDYRIPEQIAIQKLLLHQAALDSLDKNVTESQISRGVDEQMNAWVQAAGSREKLEEYRGQSYTEIRDAMHDDYRNQLLIQEERRNLVKNIKVTPADVRRYFDKLPADSLPYVPTEVEVEILTQQPRIENEEINRIKDQLREFTDRINKGETSFATLARLYSEDGSARQGGELGYLGRGQLDPAFAQVAFNLTDPKKISKIVESEYGFHIIQLIDKRGDRVNVRHILLKPRVSQAAIDTCLTRLDSIRHDILTGKFSFEEGATFISDDKDTRNNNGLMSYSDQETQTITSRFQMRNLPTEVAREVEDLAVDSISRPFKMIDNKNGKTVCAIIKLKSRREGHRANIAEDFQVMKEVVENKERERMINQWIQDKIKTTYVRMADRYKKPEMYEYKGWIK